MKKALAVIATLIFILYLAGCATNLQVNRITLNEDENSLTVIFISDLHINSLLPEKYFTKVVNKIVQFKPDIVFLGGDYVDADTENITESIKLLVPLQQFPVFAVIGNHDNWISRTSITKELEDLGFIVLDNSYKKIEVKNRILLVSGIADLYTDNISLEAALNGIDPANLCILISHSPEPYEQIKDDSRVDLMLAGHSHGGQVTAFGIWAPILPLNNRSYWRGHYDSEINHLIVTNGIGVYKYPIRFFARPGIELIKL
jgi:predicted MPP superfamily phosphohydrolase